MIIILVYLSVFFPYHTDNRIAKHDPQQLAELKEKYLVKFRTNANDSNVCTVGYCPALVVLYDNDPTSPMKGRVYYEPVFSEAAAIVSYPRKGQVIIPGLASQQPSQVNIAVSGAMAWVKRNMEVIQDYLGQQPYIDVDELVRLHQTGPNAGKPIGGSVTEDHAEGQEGEDGDEGHGQASKAREETKRTEEDSPDVDLILHVPPYANAHTFSPV